LSLVVAPVIAFKRPSPRRLEAIQDGIFHGASIVFRKYCCYCDLDRRLKTPRLRIRAEPFTRNLAFPSGRFERLGVRLNKRNVIDLIASNAVWQESGGLVVRELLQNAVEACRYRRHHSSQADAYMPAVSVTFDRDRGEITVADNGCGMTERVILNNLLTVGSSRAAEPGYASADYAPIARFGVGFWSVFTLAQSASVETTPSEVDRTQAGKAGTAYGTAFDVSLDEMKEYTVFRPVQRSGGTTVRLKVRDGIALDDVYASALAQIVCSEVPVLFRLDGEDIQLPTSIPDVPAEAVLGIFAGFRDTGRQAVSASGSSSCSDPSRNRPGREARSACRDRPPYEDR
jgi:hypothetical protein